MNGFATEQIDRDSDFLTAASAEIRIRSADTIFNVGNF